MSSGFGVPKMDWSPLERLGESYAIAQDQARRADMVRGIGVGPGDPNFLPKLGTGLLSLGDMNGALAVSRLMSADQDRAFQRSTDARDFAFRQEESQRAQGNADRTFTVTQEGLGIQRNRQAAMDKATEYYKDKADRRADESLDLQRQRAAQHQAEADAKNTAVKALPAELGARVALSQSFLEGGPELRKQIEQGGVTGAYDALKARTGYGEQGEILRRMKSGSEAIVRNLTGAGMNQEEAQARVRQYEPALTDDTPTVLKKFDMLTEQLQRIEAEAYRGRGVPANRVGKNPFFESPKGGDQAVAASPAPSGPRMVTLDKVPEGARFRRDGKVYRRVNGQDVPE